MGDNIRIDMTKDVAETLQSKLKKQKEERRKKDEKEKQLEFISSLDKESAIKELKKVRDIYNQVKYCINNKNTEIEKKTKDESVRQYLSLLSQKENLEEDKEILLSKITLLEQKICDHEYLYLMTLPKKTMTYIPSFRCLSCGKPLLGFINNNQICINEQYVEDDENSYHGDTYEYMMIQYKYNELKEENMSNDDIYKELIEELSKNHNKLSKKIRLIRKEKSE